MSIRVRCSCGEVWDIPDNQGGKQRRCSTCNQEMTIPLPKPHKFKRRSLLKSWKFLLLGIFLPALAGLAIVFAPSLPPIFPKKDVGVPSLPDNPEPPATLPASDPVKVAPERIVPTPADQPILLAWKFVPNRPLKLAVTTDSRQVMRDEGKTTTESLKQTLYFDWSMDIRPTGAWRLTLKVEGVQLEMASGIRSLRFDTTATDQENAALAKALVGAACYVHIDAKGNVVDAQTDRTFRDNLESVEPRLRPVLESSLSETAFKQIAESCLQAIPNQEVQTGDVWIRERTMPAMLGARFLTTYRYTYAGRQDKLDRVDVKGALAFQLPPTTSTPNPIELHHAILKPDLTGHVLFDAAQGRVTHLEMDLQLEGKLFLQVADKTLPVEIASRKKTTLKITSP